MYFMCMERVVFSLHSAFFKQHQRANWALTTHFVQKKKITSPEFRTECIFVYEFN